PRHCHVLRQFLPSVPVSRKFPLPPVPPFAFRSYFGIWTIRGLFSSAKNVPGTRRYRAFSRFLARCANFTQAPSQMRFLNSYQRRTLRSLGRVVARVSSRRTR